jgi:predicted porin
MQNIIHLTLISLLIFSSCFVLGNDSSAVYYGKFDISTQNNGQYDQLSQRIKHTAYTQSNGSRVGIKIHQEFIDMFSFVGQLEYAVDFNSNKSMSLDFNSNKSNDIDFSNRNTYIGIANSWGEVLIGRHDTPLKLAQGNIDLFSDSDSQMWPLQRGENRVSDALLFRSSDFNNFSLDISFVDNSNQAANKFGVSFALKYQDSNSYMAFAIDKDILDYNVARWVGSYSHQKLTVSALLQQSTSTKTNKSKQGYTLSASYQYCQYVLKMQYTHSGEIINGGKYMTIGIDWQLSDDILLYTFYTDRGANRAEDQGDLISFGMKYKF